MTSPEHSPQIRSIACVGTSARRWRAALGWRGWRVHDLRERAASSG